MPWAPVGGTRGMTSAALEKAAKDHGATIYQLGLARLLHRSPVMLPIPGTSSLAHLEENMAARKIQLNAQEWKKIGSLAERASQKLPRITRMQTDQSRSLYEFSFRCWYRHRETVHP